MNCNEEFVTKALGQLTLELGFDMPTQLKIRDILLNYKVIFKIIVCNELWINCSQFINIVM